MLLLSSLDVSMRWIWGLLGAHCISTQGTDGRHRAPALGRAKEAACLDSRGAQASCHTLKGVLVTKRRPTPLQRPGDARAKGIKEVQVSDLARLADAPTNVGTKGSLGKLCVPSRTSCVACTLFLPC